MPRLGLKLLLVLLMAPKQYMLKVPKPGKTSSWPFVATSEKKYKVEDRDVIFELEIICCDNAEQLHSLGVHRCKGSELEARNCAVVMKNNRSQFWLASDEAGEVYAMQGGRNYGKPKHTALALRELPSGRDNALPMAVPATMLIAAPAEEAAPVRRQGATRRKAEAPSLEATAPKNARLGAGRGQTVSAADPNSARESSVSPETGGGSSPLAGFPPRQYSQAHNMIGAPSVAQQAAASAENNDDRRMSAPLPTPVVPAVPAAPAAPAARSAGSAGICMAGAPQAPAAVASGQNTAPVPAEAAAAVENREDAPLPTPAVLSADTSSSELPAGGAPICTAGSPQEASAAASAQSTAPVPAQAAAYAESNAAPTGATPDSIARRAKSGEEAPTRPETKPAQDGVEREKLVTSAEQKGTPPQPHSPVQPWAGPPPQKAAFAAGNSKKLVTLHADNEVRLYTSDAAGKWHLSQHISVQFDDRLTGVAAASDGRLALSGAAGSFTVLSAPPCKRPLAEVCLAAGPARGLAWSPDGKYCAVVTPEPLLYVTESGEFVSLQAPVDATTPTGETVVVEWHPASQALVLAGAGGAYCWCAPWSNAPVRVLATPTVAAAWCPAGRLAVLTEGNDNTKFISKFAVFCCSEPNHTQPAEQEPAEQVPEDASCCYWDLQGRLRVFGTSPVRISESAQDSVGPLLTAAACSRNGRENICLVGLLGSGLVDVDVM